MKKAKQDPVTADVHQLYPVSEKLHGSEETIGKEVLL